MHYLQTEFEARDRQEELLREARKRRLARALASRRREGSVLSQLRVRRLVGLLGREPGYEVGSEEILPRPAERAKISGTGHDPELFGSDRLAPSVIGAKGLKANFSGEARLLAREGNQALKFESLLTPAVPGRGGYRRLFAQSLRSNRPPSLGRTAGTAFLSGPRTRRGSRAAGAEIGPNCAFPRRGPASSGLRPVTRTRVSDLRHDRDRLCRVG
jgi:hypothetical protein